MHRKILITILLAFSLLTIAALLNHGYWGIVAPHFQSFGAAQVLADLVIALSLFLVWVWHDAKAHGRSPWLWVLLTLSTGSIGPLIYLIVYKTGHTAEQRV